MSDGGSPNDIQMPPGQVLTRRFPVTGEKSADRILTDGNYFLEVLPPAGDPSRFTLADIMSLPAESGVVDIHCVTSWSRPGMSYKGASLMSVTEAAGIQPGDLKNFPWVRFEAWSERNHDTSLPVEFALENSWLVYEMDGKPLEPSHGYPLRLFTPSRYFYKSLKWVRLIEFLSQDLLGFWERTSAYHNVGRPWEEERFEGQSMTRAEDVAAFKNIDDFSSYRYSHSNPKVFLKANLSEWKPKSLNLSRMHIKASNFRNANLEGVNFSDSNLTLSRFHGANLRNADFRGADLEGADFSGADLTGAHFSDNPMSAVKFTHQGTPLAGWDGMIVQSPSGLLESQEQYLISLGIQIKK